MPDFFVKIRGTAQIMYRIAAAKNQRDAEERALSLCHRGAPCWHQAIENLDEATIKSWLAEMVEPGTDGIVAGKIRAIPPIEPPEAPEIVSQPTAPKASAKGRKSRIATKGAKKQGKDKVLK